MRTPERCPWCGARQVVCDIRRGYEYARFECGSKWYGVLGLWTDKEDFPPVRCKDTPSASAYRETLAWRKRLSQHTGVKLRLVPEHVACESLDVGQMIICDLGGCDLLAVCVGCKEPGDNGIDLMVCDGKKFVWRSWDGASRDSIRAEARRRLLAMGGE